MPLQYDIQSIGPHKWLTKYMLIQLNKAAIIKKYLIWFQSFTSSVINNMDIET